MKAMVLAAGQGRRMLPLTETVPKPLLEVAGCPLIEWQIQSLARAGVRDLVVNLHYLGEAIQARLGNGEHLGVSIEYSTEDVLLETAGGINQALPLLGEAPFIICNGDVWTDFDYQKLASLSLPDGQLAHLVLVPNAKHHPGGDFWLDQEGMLSSVRPNEVENTCLGKYTYAGIALLSPALFAGLPSGPQPLAPLLRQAMDAGCVSGQLFQGQWVDVGTPERLAQLNRQQT
ncbi:nucleotidyltransferase [Pseudohongiella nitratireducens]|uniref:Nucleotidyltransferase n=1 Tax=Pseudohongiella nitratireducens TaxID=1768907 RepID=A0A916QL50_9GAMM|nr:nucleotidyltransferase family protein [Pseudohongiella nitratireducens]MDF1622255.1 nucleotidyltransferase family protein [Pseudohongiella nitratireducens]GFZ76072.1 nucleotidyltransferase [Pseudohongiella nitratireducens]